MLFSYTPNLYPDLIDFRKELFERKLKMFYFIIEIKSLLIATIKTTFQLIFHNNEKKI
jgi:hypothetical protein